MHARRHSSGGSQFSQLPEHVLALAFKLTLNNLHTFCIVELFVVSYSTKNKLKFKGFFVTHWSVSWVLIIVEVRVSISDERANGTK